MVPVFAGLPFAAQVNRTAIPRQWQACCLDDSLTAAPAPGPAIPACVAGRASDHLTRQIKSLCCAKIDGACGGRAWRVVHLHANGLSHLLLLWARVFTVVSVNLLQVGS